MMIDLTASDDVESSPKPEYRKELSTTSPIHTTIPHGGIWGGGGGVRPATNDSRCCKSVISADQWEADTHVLFGAGWE